MQCETSQINILMVDDNPTNLLSLEAILQAPDRNLVRTSSGEEALRYLLECDVAVILLDVFMPGIDGLETAALIRGREKSRDIPIIFLTADNITGANYVSKGYSLGAVDYILKPIDPAILRSKVAVFVDLYKKTQEIKRQAELLHATNIELENANLERLSMLIDLGQRLAAERDPEQVLETFCQSAREIVGARYAAIGMLERDGSIPRFLLSNPASIKNQLSTGPLAFGGDLLQGIFAEREPLRLATLSERISPSQSASHPLFNRSFLGAPIISSSHLYGWLYLMDKTGTDEFSEADERLAVTLAAQVAVAYENACLYTEARINAAELAQEIAERKQAEEERARLLVRERAARAEAEQANRTKDEFLATLSHELRTPLTSILGWTRLIRQGGCDESALDRALETIERNAKAQSQLIDDLLDVSRIITGKLRLEVQPLKLASVIEAAIDSVRPAAAAKSISFVTDLDDVTDETPGDANRLQQVFWNLFSNSVKFTPERGCVTVSIRRHENKIQVLVSDTGLGINPEFLPFIFDRFRQADGSTTRKHGGLGLGLAIVRHLVELHGGTIQADSEGAGKGTVFTVTLPAANVQASSATKAGQLDQTHSALPDYGDSKIALQGMRIFVVDDEDDTRDLICVVLRQHGAEVQSYATVAQVFHAIEDSAPDLLVSDIGMPFEDGYALIKKLRQHHNPDVNTLPALALTAYASLDDRSRVLRAGFQQHIAKPVYPDKLIETVMSLAKRNALTSN